MQNRLIIAAVCMVLGGLVPTLPANQRGPGIDRVSWLQGCWHTQRGEQIIDEQWMRPLGRSMLGVGRTVRGDELVEYELVVLREQADKLTYQAYPSGQPSAVFTSTVVGDGMIVFENAEHDFPQRIGYERKGTNMIAWIAGTRDGREQRIEFPYKRAVCDAK
jgi:hypothetical protein